MIKPRKKKISEMSDEEIRIINKSRNKSIIQKPHKSNEYMSNILFERTIKIKVRDLYPRTHRHSKWIKQLGKYKNRNKGVYIFWNNNDVVYVGQTKGLQHRLTKHKTAHQSWAWNYMSWIPEKVNGDRFVIESYLIRYYQPKYNKFGID